MQFRKNLTLSCLCLAVASTTAIAGQSDQGSMLEMLYGQATSSQSSYYVQPGAVNKAVQPAVQVTQPVAETVKPTVQPVSADVSPVQPQTATQEEPSAVVTETMKSYYNNWTIEESQEKIEALGNKLLTNSGLTDYGITFKVSDEPTVNAYADGNKNIVVFTGLLELCEAEDELAFILSHEIAHIAGSHIVKGNVSRVAAGVGSAVAKKKLSGIRAKVAKVAKEYGAEEFGINSDIVGTAVDATAAAAVNYHSRAHEVDADTVGMDIMKKAGYNPMAGIAIMYRIGDNYNDIFVDHPSTDKRVVKMYNHASENFPANANAGYDSKYYKEAIGIMKNNQN